MYARFETHSKMCFDTVTKTDNSHFLCTCYAENKNSQKQGSYRQSFLRIINNLRNLILSPCFFEFNHKMNNNSYTRLKLPLD